MKTKISARSVRWAIALALTLGISHPSFAGTITGPTWVDDFSNSAIVVFSSGAVLSDVTHTLGSFTSPNSFWEITSLTITETDSGAADLVLVVGGIRDLTPTTGLTIAFSFSFDPFTPDITTGAFLAFGTQLHGSPEFDALSITVQANVSGSEITGYGIGMGMSHHVVPEPATLLLMGSGLVGLAGLGRRRKRH